MWELEKTEVKNQSWEGSHGAPLDESHVGWMKERMECGLWRKRDGYTEDLSREEVDTELVRRKRGHWDPMGAEEEDTELGEMGVTETL